MAIPDVSIIHHTAISLLLLWGLKSFDYDHPISYLLCWIYLYQIHQRYIMRLTRKLQFEERRSANQKRVLSDSETVRWLNHAMEKIWPLCLEEVISKKIFLPLIPWFLDKYKPWTVKRAAVQSLYLGRNPPAFTSMRVLHESSDDDHLVLELGINFLTADDMGAILETKLKKKVGFGIVAKMHLTSLHVEGKVLVGVKFTAKWPYISRVRICFAQPPYFQMTVKPLFNRGIDVTEIPGIAGWLDNLLAMVFQQTLVEPNMLVVDMEKFVSPQQEDWFSVFVREPFAYARVEIIEAADIKPSDLNGLSDPYLKGQLGPYRFRTQIQKNTLTPRWQEEFKIPLCSWQSENILAIEVRDKDTLVDDRLGVCTVDLNDLRGGQRHDMWVALKEIKMGRVHLAITIFESKSKDLDRKPNDNKSFAEDYVHPSPNEKPPEKASSSQSQKVNAKFESVDFEGQKETGIWVHHPGTEAPSVWEPRKGKGMQQSDTEVLREGAANSPNSSSRGSLDNDLHIEGNQPSGKENMIRKGLRKINTAIQRNKKDDIVISNSLREPPSPSPVKPFTDDALPVEELAPENNRRQVKAKAMNIFKQAGKSAKKLKFALSRKSMGSKSLNRPNQEEEKERGYNKDETVPTEQIPSPSSLYEEADSESTSLGDDNAELKLSNSPEKTRFHDSR